MFSLAVARKSVTSLTHRSNESYSCMKPQVKHTVASALLEGLGRHRVLQWNVTHIHRFYVLCFFFYVLLTVHLGIILVTTNLTHSSFPYMFISILYKFRATICSSSGESIVSIRLLAYFTLCGDHLVCKYGWNCSTIHTCIPGRSPHRMTYARCRNDTVDSPDDQHMVARNL